MQQLGIASQTAPTAPAADEEGWADQDLTVPEKFVKNARPLIAELPRFAGEVQQTFGQHAQYITHVLNQNAALQAQIQALCELNDVKFPDAKFNGYDPKQHASYADELKKMAGTRKAAKQPVPKTPQTRLRGQVSQR